MFVVGAIFTACSFAIAPLEKFVRPGDGEAVLLFACLGSVGAAAALLAIIAVLGPGPYWLRIPLSFGAGLLLVGWGLFGEVVASFGEVYSLDASDGGQLASLLLCLPLFFLVIQSPLWLARLLLRWELSVPDPAGVLAPPPRSTIRGMLIAMAVVGLSLAGARLGGQLNIPVGRAEEDFWIQMMIVLAVCSGASLFSTLPILTATLRTRSVFLAVTIVAIYAAAWLVAILVVMNSIDSVDETEIAYMTALMLSFAAALTVPLLMVRRLGFRLRWGRESGPPGPGGIRAWDN